MVGSITYNELHTRELLSNIGYILKEPHQFYQFTMLTICNTVLENLHNVVPQDAAVSIPAV